MEELKPGKALGFAGVYPELLINCSLATTDFFNCILESGRHPALLKQIKIVAILMLGKEGRLTSDYRPTALLSICCNILERLILNSISD